MTCEQGRAKRQIADEIERRQLESERQLKVEEFRQRIGPDEYQRRLETAKRMDELRRAALHEVRIAVAFSIRVWIDNGTLHVESSRADEIRQRLCKFNQVIPEFGESLTAFYFRTEFMEDVE